MTTPEGASEDASPPSPVDPQEEDPVAAQTAYRERLKGDLVRGSLWTLVATAVAIPINFGVSLVVAHSLGPSGLGRLATYTAIFGLVTIALNVGTTDATVQWIAEARALGRRATERALIRRCAGYHAFIEGPLVALVALILVWPAGPAPAVVSAVFVWLIQALGTSTVVMTATAQNALVARLTLITTLITEGTVVAVAVSTHSSLLIFAYPLAATCAGPALCLLALDHDSRSAILSPRLAFDDPAGFRRYALSACAGTLVSTLVYGRSEIFLLKAHHLTVPTGLFALATGLASQITIPMDSLMGPIVPTAAGLYASAPERAAAALRRALGLTSALGALTAATIVPAVYLGIPLLYGAHFRGADRAFEILGFVSCLQSVIVPVSAFALATRSAGAVLRTNLLCLLTDAALAVTLIPVLGLYGAVVANGAAQVLSLALLTRVVNRRVGTTWSDTANTCRAFALGPIIGSAAIAIGSVVPSGALVRAIVALGVGLALFHLAARISPAIRLPAEDLAEVVGRLPRSLKPVFRSGLRLCGLLIEGDRPESA